MKIIMCEHAIYGSVYKVGGQNIAEYLINKKHNVLYFSGHLNILSVFKLIYSKSEKLDIYQMLKNVFTRYVSSNFIIFTPIFLIPITRKLKIIDNYFFAKFLLKSSIINIKILLRLTGFTNPDVVIVSVPMYSGMFKLFPRAKKIYRITDDIESFSNIPVAYKKMIYDGIKESDQIILTSELLIDKIKQLKEYKNKISIVGNGVDIKKFNNKIDYKIPAEIQLLKANGFKIIIYVGSIHDWFDCELVEYLANNLNGKVKILIVGNIHNHKANKLINNKNILYLGSRPNDLIPNYLKYSDLGIIPFDVSHPVLSAVNPIKLYEYCAMGLNVVSTEWSELSKKNAPISLAKSYREFLDKVNNSLENRNFSEKELLEFANSNSWDNIINKLINEIQ